MIEKIYKEACDEIHGDRKAILDKAFERAQKPVKKRNPVLKYSVIGTAAAAVLVAGAIFINIDLFKITEPKDFEGDTVVSESASDVKETENVFTAEKETEVISESETKPQAVRKEEKVGGKTEDSTKEEDNVKKDKKQGNGAVNDSGKEQENAKNDDSPETEENVPETASEAAGTNGRMADRSYKAEKNPEPLPEDNGIDAYCDDDDDLDEAPTAGAPTAGSKKPGMYSMSNSVYDEKVMTYDEYKAYLGFDVTTLRMPEGTAPIEKPEKCVVTVDENGKIVDDIVVFENKDAAKPVVVTAGKLLNVGWALKDGNTEAVISEESGVIYAQKNGAGFFVECMNMADEEIYAIEAQFKGER